MKTRLFILAILIANSVFSQTKPFVLGVTETIASKTLKEKRTINIYLPDGYKKNDTTHYPVIYLLDGGADEDFIHVVGLVQFNTFDWVHRIPKSIVVGIANTDRKRDMLFPTSIAKNKEEYPTSGHSDKFIAFIEKELQPYIASHYKTNNDKTIIGESAGGLLATEILLKHTSMFNRYIIISPSVWWDNGSILKQSLSMLAQDTLLKGIYIGVGKEGLTPGANPLIQEEVVQELYNEIKGVNKHAITSYEYLPQETHATIGHIALFHAFRLLYPERE
ncbi:MAG: alpha/beta hydrolase [Bacteroidetes bacterium]|nr:alpha/beta hydrolase [Bacteroidota bacterium]